LNRFFLSFVILPVLASTSLLRAAQASKPPAAVPQVQQSTENQFSTSITLFSALAAINAAGYDTGMDSSLNERFRVRTEVREELKKRQIPSLAELKEFYQAHLKASGSANLGQYISFALIANGPPNFEVPTLQVPPDVAELKGFDELLARFYKEANLEELWNRAQPAYESAIGQYQEPVINTLFEANGYVRNPSGYLGRRFQVYLDLLGEPNQIQVRSYRDDYYVVITPTTAPVVDQVRDAYLSYLLDPLTFKYAEVIKTKKSLEKLAQDAPALDLAYKDDFSLLMTKCLVKAITARMTRSGANRQQLIDQAMREGFVLTAAFSDLLPAYEKQQEALRIYYPDLINAIDVRKEQKRIRSVDFVQTAAPAVAVQPAKMQLDPAEQTLQAAEGLYEQGQYDLAEKQFKHVFEQTTDRAMQGRAYYGLARIATRQNKKDEAVELFQRTADCQPGPGITAWAHVYLGRLALAAGDPTRAQAQFKQALALEGASAAARQAAENGLQTTNSSGDKQE
jgi:predicted negative regulator of RcsB-dependent stress response